MKAATEALRATTSSGLRSVFCYSSIWRIKSWSSAVEYDDTLLPDWWYDTLASLAKSAPYGDGRVTLGVGFDQFQLPKEQVIRLWEKARELGVKLMTTHFAALSMKSMSSTAYIHKIGELIMAKTPSISYPTTASWTHQSCSRMPTASLNLMPLS